MTPISRAVGVFNKPWLICGLIVTLGTIVRLKQLFNSLNGHQAFRLTQTALVSRNYAEDGIDLWHTPLTVFGKGSDVPMEFPLVQAVAALIIRMGLPADVTMRLISLTAFQATALMLFALVIRWHGPRVAVIAIVLLEFSPLTMEYGATSLIEFPAVALGIAMVLAVDHWFTGGRWWWLAVGAVSGWLAFLVKVTTAPAYVLLLTGSAAAVLLHHGWRRSWRRLLVGGAVAVGPGLALALAWTRYADNIKAGHPLTAWLTSSALHNWNFGTPSQRYDIGSYAALVNSIAGELAGPYALTLFAGVAVAALASTRADRVRGLVWALPIIIVPLIFLNLYLVHNYYLCAVVPPIVVLAALGIDGLVRLVGDRSRRMVLAAVATSFVLITSALSPLGRADINEWRMDRPPSAGATLIAAHAEPGSRIILIGCDWDPTIAYTTHRDAVMFRGPADSRAYWSQATDVNEYGWLYSCDSTQPAAYLPPGATATPSGQPGLWRVSQTG